MTSNLLEKIRHCMGLKRALLLIWQSAPGWTLSVSGLVALQGVLPLLSLYLMKLIIDGISSGLQAGGEKETWFTVLPIITCAGLVGLARVSSSALATKAQAAQTQLVTMRLHHDIHKKAIAAHLEWYENPQFHDMLHRAQSEVGYRPTSIINGLTGAAQNAISLGCVLGLLFFLDWIIAAVVLVSALPEILVHLKYADKMYHWQRERTPEERRSWFYHFMITSRDYAKEIRLFKLGTHFTERYLDIEKQLFREKQSLLSRRCLAELISRGVATTGIFVSLAYISYCTFKGQITLGAMVMYFQAFQQGQEYFQETMRRLAGLYEDNLFLSSLYEILDLPDRMKEPEHARSFPCPIRYGIEFCGLEFGYPGKDRPVLQDLNLRIYPGEIVALVGENGSGKTTLVKLLCRFYDPVKGKISIDGIDLRLIPSTDVQRQLSVIFQDYGQYPFTARENIQFGNLAAPTSGEEIEAAARRSGADAFIRTLPHGYETILCNWFEAGEEISMGQWQKVALARTLFRDGQIIVLDEPTSCMDAKSEYSLFCRLRELANGRILILISHRLQNIKFADRILVLADGRLAEEGSHDQLLRRGGIYAELFASQAAPAK